MDDKATQRKHQKKTRSDWEGHEFSFGFVEFEVFLRHPNGEAERVAGFKNLELRISYINLM